ncbi:hypothetical protein EIN_176150 [Entamoeba invadens IP1]|uniref:hypothetical protein n=1 Tax=Entamoeba invadens IP1 TaxID=370355 RepID=UPI0002C3D219|nr:hypothetical protein EIN_176150 [Entamoeba invadens IP1]ELP93808.1 hypothetical protein EIN_176150 [Entamoeba invadens IP1]|eukprot:XP_004260579.1 hypothetical protein EIN_176150 [Entamoeba invadens IP1]
MKTSCPVQVNFQKCIGCLQCVRVCPKGVLTSTHMKSTVTYPENCIACGCCSSVCPVGAIIFNGVSPSKIDIESFGDVEENLHTTANQVTSDDEKVPPRFLATLIEKAKFSITTEYNRKFNIIVLNTDKTYPQLVCVVSDKLYYVDDLRFLSTLSLILTQHNIHWKFVDYTDESNDITCALAVGKPQSKN